MQGLTADNRGGSDEVGQSAPRLSVRGNGSGHVREIQGWLQTTKLAGLVIPSTDEFVSEFAPPANRRLRWATGFRGSTGVAVILRDRAALFVDGRYQLQGRADTEEAAIEVELASWSARSAWLQRFLTSGARLGLDPWLHSMSDVSQWQSAAVELAFELELCAEDPLDELWLDDRPSDHAPLLVDYPVDYAGETYQAKCASLIQHVRSAGLQALLLADPEDVSWLLNVRASEEALKVDVGDWHIVPSCGSRALVHQDGYVSWFVDSKRVTPEVAMRSTESIRIESPERLIASLRTLARRGPVGADLYRTPAALALVIRQAGSMRADNTAARRRYRKDVVELEAARRAHILDAAAVVRFVAWLTRTVRNQRVSECEAAETLEAFRREQPAYKGPSEPVMAASGPSGAQPHYIPRRNACRYLNDHPIFWVDSGGQYFGGTTDNTITLALDTPEAKHVLAHTLVLRGFIALATARVPAGTSALRLDSIARHALWQEGMDYTHGTGHGVGNYLNIHEGPVMRSEPSHTTTLPIEPGLILTNEPGYYAPGDFGLRIESHMVVVESRYPEFVEFETISRLPIDPRLVDFARLSVSERRWLADYHRSVWQDLQSLLDSSSATWLRTVVEFFIQAEGSTQLAGDAV